MGQDAVSEKVEFFGFSKALICPSKNRKMVLCPLRIERVAGQLASLKPATSFVLSSEHTVGTPSFAKGSYLEPSEASEADDSQPF